jgi:hypothetical protein
MMLAGLAMAGMGAASGAALAGSGDYRFEAVRPQVTVSPAASVAVRLVHVPTGKPVAGAVIFQPRMEMPMGNLAPMATKVAPAAPDGKGEYPFTADISMAGPWTLTLSAKVQGEAATITGSVPFTAVKGGHDHNH